MNTIKYIPRHPDGRTGPSFDYATMACIWIALQSDATQWNWEQGQPKSVQRDVQRRRQAMKNSHCPFSRVSLNPSAALT